MKKTKIGQGRKLLLRGEAIARLTPVQLEHVAGGDVYSGIWPLCSHGTSLEIPPAAAAAPDNKK